MDVITPEPVAPSKKSATVFVYILIGVVLLAAGFGVGYIASRALTQQNTTSNTQENVSNYDTQNDEENVDEQKNTDPSTPVTQTKVLVDLEEPWFREQLYPAEISALTDNNLKEIRCSDEFQKMDDTYVNMLTGQTVTLDETLRGSAEDVAIGTNQTSFTIQECKTIVEEGQAPEYFYIYSYCPERCGGASGKINGVFYFDNFDSGVEFVNTTGAYEACNVPIAYTNENKFYLQCGAGDSVFSASQIYRIDIMAGTADSVERVQFVGEIPE